MGGHVAQKRHGGQRGRIEIALPVYWYLWGVVWGAETASGHVHCQYASQKTGENCQDHVLEPATLLLGVAIC